MPIQELPESACRFKNFLNRHSTLSPGLESAADSGTFVQLHEGFFDPMLEPAVGSSTFHTIARGV